LPTLVISAEKPAPRVETFPPAPFAGDQASSQGELLALMDKPEPVLAGFFDVGGPGKMNQGNAALALHAVSRNKCRAGLSDVTLQTPEQRAICGGHPLMVPIYEGGDPKKAKACIDVFEFPNRACELPFVWTAPTPADQVCRALGKRLCTQDEWVQACSADPMGGKRSRYAYGEKLDLTICNTDKPKGRFNTKGCDPTTIKSAWQTCSTNTEPSGAFPRCRSRLGVYDLHGNVAEAMTRREEDGKTVSQLKGSAFFYVDVHVPDGEESRRETYSDHCAHDPRWHVESMVRAWHVNYHLGFRCCYTAVER
jgi:hypothetical protein